MPGHVAWPGISTAVRLVGRQAINQPNSIKENYVTQGNSLVWLLPPGHAESMPLAYVQEFAHSQLALKQVTA